MICPHCGEKFSSEEVENIRAQLMAEQGKKTSDAKKRTSAENGKKGGRPKKQPTNT